MIRIKSEKGKAEIAINGNLVEIEADLVVGIRGLVKALKEKNEKVACQFEEFIKEELVKGIFQSEDDMKEEIAKSILELIEELIGDDGEEE